MDCQLHRVMIDQIEFVQATRAKHVDFIPGTKTVRADTSEILE